jgi:NAD(P)-dependent dehydrogenase (short-subunit alcohol dehydrogenase family)
VFLVGRSESSVLPLIGSIEAANPSVEVVFIPCNLAKQDSVRAAAAMINARTDKIHIIINSAGVMANPDYLKSADGIEMQFATNHVGPFLLTCLLLSKIVTAGNGARIVNLTSTGHVISDIRYDDLNFTVSIVPSTRSLVLPIPH